MLLFWSKARPLGVLPYRVSVCVGRVFFAKISQDPRLPHGRRRRLTHTPAERGALGTRRGGAKIGNPCG
jgi:hypothetical protein